MTRVPTLADRSKRYVHLGVFTALTVAVSAPSSAQLRPPASSGSMASLAGDWAAPMPMNGALAHWVFSLRDSLAGQYAGTVLLAEAAAPRASVAVVLRGDSLIISGPRGLRFAGVRSASNDGIAGSVTFGGATSPTTMVRIVRPQRVQTPVPYRSRELTISASDSVRLSATLTLPEGRGPFPAVALISGSGP